MYLRKLYRCLYASIVFFTLLSAKVFANSSDQNPDSFNDFALEAPAKKKCDFLIPQPKRLETTKKTQIAPQRNYLIEIAAGYFFFSDPKMRKIYKKGGFDLQMRGSYPVWRWLQIYSSIEYLKVNGKSLGAYQKTRLEKIPVSLGLKAVANLSSKIQYYFTLGPRYFFVNQHNYSSYVNRNVNRNDIGGFANTGFTFSFYHGLTWDVFGEYSYEQTHFHSSQTNVYDRSIQIGGFTFGSGLGYLF